MSKKYNQFHLIQNIPLKLIGIGILFCLALFLFWFNEANNHQAMSAIAATVRFEGEYRIGDDEWQEIVAGEHISSTKGDVTLKGNFHLYAPDGEYVGILNEEIPIAIYTDHINVAIQNEDFFEMLENENPLYGSSACGAVWTAHSFMSDDIPIEMVIHNPHNFGNENAVDDLLSNVAIWGNIEFEKGILESGASQRNIGFIFIIVASALLGTALFSTLLHVQNSQIIWLLGLTTLFAGSYFVYTAFGVSVWSDSISFNTTIVGVSMMFYMLFILGIVVNYLENNRKIAKIVTCVVGIVDGICLILPTIMNIYFYDTLKYWTIVQAIANLIVIGCLIKEYFETNNKNRNIFIGMILLLISFVIDLIATSLGYWKGGFISKHLFVVLFVIALFIVLNIIPKSINAAAKAKELELQRSRLEAEKNKIEVELKESRISLMLSQIRPHFIYNTLGTIERLCLKDPKKAFELVRNFSLYLRGNFSELDSIIPIRLSEEIKHVEYYVNIEKVRFPDMNVEYQLESTNFVLPALSIQPLVENAIKHGLMGLETGGTVYIRSYETKTHFCVEVIDNGVGFDVNLIIDDKKHVGLHNIKERLKAMVYGDLVIESDLNSGTRALIMIPKEVIE